MTLLDVWGPVGPRLLVGGPSGWLWALQVCLTSSFTIQKLPKNLNLFSKNLKFPKSQKLFPKSDIFRKSEMFSKISCFSPRKSDFFPENYEWWRWLIYFELFLPGCPGSQHCQPSQVAGQVLRRSELGELDEGDELDEDKVDELNEVDDKEVEAIMELFGTYSFWMLEQQLSAALQQSASRDTSSGSWQYFLSLVDNIWF